MQLNSLIDLILSLGVHLEGQYENIDKSKSITPNNLLFNLDYVKTQK